jgi:hypothetical protein
VILFAVGGHRRTVIVPARHHENYIGEIGERGREGLVQIDTHLVRSQLLGALHPAHVLEGEHAVVLVGDMVHGIDDIVGIEARSVVEDDVIAEIEFEGNVVDPLVARREQWLVLAAVQIPEQQAVPGRVSDDYELAGIVVVRIGDRDLAVGGPDEGIVGLAGQGRVDGRKDGQGDTKKQA